MNCIVVEDEPAAQAILTKYMGMYPDLNCRGVFSDAMAAQAYLNKTKIDLIFLDVNLPDYYDITKLFCHDFLLLA
jgi:response regulator of citrate/malate metabolism